MIEIRVITEVGGRGLICHGEDDGRKMLRIAFGSGYLWVYIVESVC